MLFSTGIFLYKNAFPEGNSTKNEREGFKPVGVSWLILNGSQQPCLIALTKLKLNRRKRTDHYWQFFFFEIFTFKCWLDFHFHRLAWILISMDFTGNWMAAWAIAGVIPDDLISKSTSFKPLIDQQEILIPAISPIMGTSDKSIKSLHLSRFWLRTGAFSGGSYWIPPIRSRNSTYSESCNSSCAK